MTTATPTNQQNQATDQVTDIMIDIETLAQSTRASIVSIGACIFNPYTGEIGPKFYREIDPRTSEYFCDIDAATVQWWARQSDDARAVLNSANAIDIEDAMSDLSDFITDNAGPLNKRRVWANPDNFDIAILDHSITNMLGAEHDLYPHWASRNVRNIVDLGRDLLDIDPKKTLEFEGTRHRADHDAIHQAKYVSAIMQELATATAYMTESRQAETPIQLAQRTLAYSLRQLGGTANMHEIIVFAQSHFTNAVYNMCAHFGEVYILQTMQDAGLISFQEETEQWVLCDNKANTQAA